MGAVVVVGLCGRQLGSDDAAAKGRAFCQLEETRRRLAGHGRRRGKGRGVAAGGSKLHLQEKKTKRKGGATAGQEKEKESRGNGDGGHQREGQMTRKEERVWEEGGCSCLRRGWLQPWRENDDIV
ncbi:hypothetical protein OIU74_015993 [Salix koriyanagi]|uniref:Uncharacterized protein n=1 Tax=Salix koriyanagi TaxID=2511006 RepID=A0A9Q0PNQ3_9ROSI|nr:hypothetical protein OIU74_015993 [Salix koriyanagi]